MLKSHSFLVRIPLTFSLTHSCLQVSPEIAILIYEAFDNKTGIKNDLTKYFMKVVGKFLINIYPSKIFPTCFAYNVLSKLTSCFCLLQALMGYTNHSHEKLTPNSNNVSAAVTNKYNNLFKSALLKISQLSSIFAPLCDPIAGLRLLKYVDC